MSDKHEAQPQIARLAEALIAGGTEAGSKSVRWPMEFEDGEPAEARMLCLTPEGYHSPLYSLEAYSREDCPQVVARFGYLVARRFVFCLDGYVMYDIKGQVHAEASPEAINPLAAMSLHQGEDLEDTSYPDLLGYLLAGHAYKTY